MADPCVKVTINKNDECIYDKSFEKSKNFDISGLLDTLKTVKSQTNLLLTEIIESERKLNQGQTSEVNSEQDDDNDSSEDVDIDPKKYEIMSTTLSNQAQLRYIVEWFQEWSEMQRGDFLGILVERCGPADMVNGIVSGIEGLGCKEEPTRPPSLFQCRVKLFQEWSQNWSQQEKDSLLSSIKNIDPKFAEKYERRVATGSTEEENSS